MKPIKDSSIKAQYLNGYPEALLKQVEHLLASKQSSKWLLNKYPRPHNIGDLYEYAIALKNQNMRSSSPISKVIYDDKIHAIKNALGTHSYVSRKQGSKLKAKNEIRIAALFRNLPEPFLKMIVVHELAHLKEKEHSKAFYKLCCYMEAEYHQLEFDLRVYLNHRDHFGDLWKD
ncbi:DUF45 domain-containing protein [Marinomonas sp. C2222]|uniref:DUF45 domain-containing protein n=1 Tax=Marinomonas sargassi TaxID=2984494 RepID=A0ABT2YQ14_9GAMM|nr:YgjP-like metallopeptidase domain-containing protein [Marinomonas sargassi]MCV2401970.1 DUF45 domain-containing protein [Marinomonas sargassi]